MSTDVDELVDSARAGDRGAFDALVRATYVDTYTLAHRLTGDEDDARDVVQEAYLRAFRGLRRFRGDAQFTTWLYRITANCASTHLGRRRRHRHEELDDELPLDDLRPASDPVGRAENGQLRERLQAALLALPPAYGPWSCCETSMTCPTTPSPPSSASRSRRPRSGCTGPGASSATTCSCETPSPARGSGPVPCDRLTERLAAAVDDASALGELEWAHVAQCLRCQADLAQYRRLRRLLANLGDERQVPTPELLAGLLADLDVAMDRQERHRHAGRRAAYFGGLAAATAAGVGGVLVLATRRRPA